MSFFVEQGPSCLYLTHGEVMTLQVSGNIDQSAETLSVEVHE